MSAPKLHASGPPLTLFSVVIPARDEAESLPATLEHLHLEFNLNQIPHEIVVAWATEAMAVAKGLKPAPAVAMTLLDVLKQRLGMTVERD